VDEAVQFFSSLDKQCHVQLLTEAAAASGIKKSIISDEDAAFTAKTLQWWENMYVNVSEARWLIFRLLITFCIVSSGI